MRPELGHGNHADLYSGVELLHHLAWLRIALFLLLASFFGELSAPVSGESLRDPALRRLIRQLAYFATLDAPESVSFAE